MSASTVLEIEREIAELRDAASAPGRRRTNARA